MCTRCGVNPGKTRNEGLCDACFLLTGSEISDLIRFRIWKRRKPRKK